MGKFISNFFLWTLAIVLSIFTASRTLDLLGWALPVGQEIYQWLGLASFEGAMWFWAFYFIHGAKGTYQRGIAIIMTVFSIVGVCVALVSDLIVDASQAGKLPKLPVEQSQSVIIFLGVVIAMNIAAFIACKLLSIDNLRTMKEQDAEDIIHNAGLLAITSLAPSIAASAAPHLATEWANRTWDRLVPGAHGSTHYLPAPAQAPAQLSAPAPAPAPMSKTIDADKSIDAPVNKMAWVGRILAKKPKSLPEPAPVQSSKLVSQRLTHTVPLVRKQLPPIAQQRRANRQQRFRPTTQLVTPAPAQDEKVTVQPPLSQEPIQVKKNQGAYVVNHGKSSQARKFPTND